ncbi:substrate-binding domain-containing protein [Dysgonomonas sp. Marseille-P4677]|uniref:PstS family phosphate ABC transporter substrate-binding protein n=1 Tax=Dysgonomonas sp. Marseille-P4677 TaxID=2364790 RepID=UPI0019131E8E|nr:substrate-binding domain-containing protein [Dysgonomonas sp. Marseille-P4677]MBK5721534.1 substrate-binding domain-containing protein [Dysgonomonas sp. Marseille-P4677]
MKRSGFILFISIVFFWALSSCGQKKGTRTDTPTSGLAEIVADECFAPIVQEQVDVFEALNRDATIISIYANEMQAFDLFMKDSVRVIIAARELSPGEEQIIKDRQQTIRSQKYATDAIALIVNKANPDTLITVADIKRIMTGEIRSWKDLNPKSPLGEIAISFDSPNSSTVRYIRDSICGGTLGGNLKARASDSTRTIDLAERTPNQQVIDYVASTPNAVGIIGVNWISNPSDSTNLSFISNIKVMGVSRAEKATDRNSFQPLAAYVGLGKYPLSRDLFIIISDVRGGLPSGFVNFAAGERGQRIVYKAGLYPAYALTRVVSIRPSL